MRAPTRLALTLLASLTAAPAAFAGALATDDPQATLSWRLDWGGGALLTGYGLALGYPSAVPGLAADRLLELEVSRQAARARLAGLPLLERGARLDQAAREDLQPEAGETPWYARPWVWWTAGGLALTAALAGGGGGNETSQEINVSSGRICAVNGGTVADEPIPSACVPQQGAGSGWTARTAPAGGAGDPAREAWLDAGTGQMGDLVAR
jgi:hypothetical protein